MAIIIRPAAPADAAELHELAARTFGLATPAATRQADIDAYVAAHLTQARFAEYLADPARIVLIAAQDGTAVGYAMLVDGPIKDPELAAVVAAAAGAATTAVELSKFYVAPAHHGSGVAATLMAATLEAAAATGARLCWLGVHQGNERAARFYAKHGFEIIGTKRFLVGEDWQDDHVRARPL